MKLLTQKTDVELLHEYLFRGADVQLSDALSRKLARLEKADALYRQEGDRQLVITGLMNYVKTTWPDENYSKRTAYLDFQEMQELYSSGYRHDVRQYQVDIVMAEVMKTKRQAEQAVDAKGQAAPNVSAMAACDANLIKILEKFFGEHEKIDWSKVAVPDTVLVFEPELIRSNVPTEPVALKALTDKFRKARIKKPVVVDIPYEDIR